MAPERGFCEDQWRPALSLRAPSTHEGGVLESYVTKTRDKPAALTFLEEGEEATWMRHGRSLLQIGYSSYGAAMKEIGNDYRQEVGRHLINRAENSQMPFRRTEERSMSRGSKA